jgi:glutathione S-transferase
MSNLPMPILYGADYSVYVRIARMTLIEKGVEHDRVPVDVFDPAGTPDWYGGFHPFGRIPAFAHAGRRLYETSAICRYVDEAFDGPALQRGRPEARAAMNLIIGLLDAYGYRAMVWDIAVETVERARDGGRVDEDKVAAAMPVARRVLAELDRHAAASRWLAGDALSLADCHAAPIIGYFPRAPLAAPMLTDHPALRTWWERISARPSWLTTQPVG